MDEENESMPGPSVIQVGAYSFCLEQADAIELSEREKNLLNEHNLLAPAYRLRLYVIPDGQDMAYSGLLDEGGMPVQSVGEQLPDDAYPEGIRLLILPTDDIDAAPEGAQQIYISCVDQPGDVDVTEILPATFRDMDGMLYAEIPLSGDGFYAVAAPEGWSDEDGDIEDEDFEDEDLEDEDLENEDFEDEDFEDEDLEDEDLEDEDLEDEDFGDEGYEEL